MYGNIHDLIEIDGKFFMKYDDMYYVSATGDVYSTFSKKCLKHYIDHNGYHRVDIHGKHIRISKLVYLTWKGEIPKGKIIRHIDDDKDNNMSTNLILGSQKENMYDAFRNNHKEKSGNTHYLKLFDKIDNKTLCFCPAKDFIKFSGHPCSSGSLKKTFKKKWFKERYDIIEYGLGKCND